MNTKRAWLLVAVLTLSLALVSGFAWAQAAAMKARPVAAAVVDVQKAFDSLAEKVQVEAELQTRADRLKQEEQSRQKKLEELQKDMEMLAAGSPAFAQKEEEIARQLVELQAWRNFQTQKLTRERGLQIEGLYRKIVDSIGRLAKENGYDIVLFKEGPADFRNAKPEQLTALIQVRKVLWASNELDLTDQLVQRMNNEFKNMAAPTASNPK